MLIQSSERIVGHSENPRAAEGSVLVSPVQGRITAYPDRSPSTPRVHPTV